VIAGTWRAVQVTLAELAAHLGPELVLEVIGDPALPIARLAPLASADAASVSFLSNPRFAAQLQSTRAGCVIVAPLQRDEAAARGAVLVSSDPYACFARLTQWWAAVSRPRPPSGVHASAVVEEGAQIHASASIGALAFVSSGAVIGADVVVGSHCHVGAHAHVGEGTRLAAHVTLADGCWIGARGVVHSGAVIGADGFGFAPHSGQWIKIEQLGLVRVGDDVEIGANTCIDRGALDDTVIGHGVKLDNLIQIGHNVQIGDHCAFAGCVGVAGSTKFGRRCTAGGSAMILGHLELADDVHISAATVVSRSILKPGQYTGFFPCDENAAWEKNAATLRNLHQLRQRLRALENKA
jgi:UDP-3-O-[3-hydroxymyristoyl] glucosamine N-acyltransferase